MKKNQLLYSVFVAGLLVILLSSMTSTLAKFPGQLDDTDSAAATPTETAATEPTQAITAFGMADEEAPVESTQEPTATEMPITPGLMASTVQQNTFSDLWVSCSASGVATIGYTYNLSDEQEVAISLFADEGADGVRLGAPSFLVQSPGSGQATTSISTEGSDRVYAILEWQDGILTSDIVSDCAGIPTELPTSTETPTETPPIDTITSLSVICDGVTSATVSFDYSFTVDRKVAYGIVSTAGSAIGSAAFYTIPAGSGTESHTFDTYGYDSIYAEVAWGTSHLDSELVSGCTSIPPSSVVSNIQISCANGMATISMDYSFSPPVKIQIVMHGGGGEYLGEYVSLPYFGIGSYSREVSTRGNDAVYGQITGLGTSIAITTDTVTGCAPIDAPSETPTGAPTETQTAELTSTPEPTPTIPSTSQSVIVSNMTVTCSGALSFDYTNTLDSEAFFYNATTPDVSGYLEPGTHHFDAQLNVDQVDVANYGLVIALVSGDSGYTSVNRSCGPTQSGKNDFGSMFYASCDGTVKLNYTVNFDATIRVTADLSPNNTQIVLDQQVSPGSGTLNFNFDLPPGVYETVSYQLSVVETYSIFSGLTVRNCDVSDSATPSATSTATPVPTVTATMTPTQAPTETPTVAPTVTTAPAKNARILVSPRNVSPGQLVTVSVKNFGPNESVLIRWNLDGAWVDQGTIVTDGSGAGSITIAVPDNVEAGSNSVRADSATRAQQTNAVMVRLPDPPTARVRAPRATVNAPVNFSLRDFPATSTVDIVWSRPDGSSVSLGSVTTDSHGSATGSVNVPETESGSNSIVFSSGASSASAALEVIPSVTISPTSIPRSGSVTMALSGYAANETIVVRWQIGGKWVVVATVTSSTTGSVTATIAVPANASTGNNRIQVVGTLTPQDEATVRVIR